jgi:hypothetical protein
LCIATVLIPKNAGIVFSGVELRDVGQLIWACFIPHGSPPLLKVFWEKRDTKVWSWPLLFYQAPFSALFYDAIALMGWVLGGIREFGGVLWFGKLIKSLYWGIESVLNGRKIGFKGTYNSLEELRNFVKKSVRQRGMLVIGRKYSYLLLQFFS